MIIDGTNILTAYGLKLSKVSGNLNLAPRKKILQKTGFEQKDIRFEEHQINVILFGTFDTKVAVYTMSQNLMSLMGKKVIHDIQIPQHQISIKGIFAEGIKVETFNTTALLTIQITVTNE